MLNIFKRTTPRRIVVARSTSMRLFDWTRDPGLVRQANDLAQTPLFQTMVAILRNESPSSYGLPMGANHDDRIAHACRAEGYALALNNLEALSVQTQGPMRIESTFAPEEGPMPSLAAPLTPEA